MNRPLSHHVREDRTLTEIYHWPHRPGKPEYGWPHRIGQINLIRVAEEGPGQDCPWHWHGDRSLGAVNQPADALIETFICISGYVKVMLTGGTFAGYEEYELEPGESVTVPPLVSHKLITGPGAVYLEVRNVLYDPERPDKTFEDKGQEERVKGMNDRAEFRS